MRSDQDWRSDVGMSVSVRSVLRVGFAMVFTINRHLGGDYSVPRRGDVRYVTVWSLTLMYDGEIIYDRRASVCGGGWEELLGVEIIYIVRLKLELRF